MIIRIANQNDMPIVHMMAHDLWGEGKPDSEHIALCLASPKYAKGRWFVLEHEGELKSSLICYRDAFSLPSNTVGIGSVATAFASRRKGFATTLVRGVIDSYSMDRTVEGFFLYSDVDPSIYEKLGFVKLPAEHQRYKSSTAMVLPLHKPLQSLISRDFMAPDYF